MVPDLRDLEVPSLQNLEALSKFFGVCDVLHFADLEFPVLLDKCIPGYGIVLEFGTVGKSEDARPLHHRSVSIPDNIMYLSTGTNLNNNSPRHFDHVVNSVLIDSDR